MPTEEEKREIRERLDRLAAGEKLPPRKSSEPIHEEGFMGARTGAPPTQPRAASAPAEGPPARRDPTRHLRRAVSAAVKTREDPDTGGVVITDIQIPFTRLIGLLVELAIAAVPAAIIVFIFWSVVLWAFGYWVLHLLLGIDPSLSP